MAGRCPTHSTTRAKGSMRPHTACSLARWGSPAHRPGVGPRLPSSGSPCVRRHYFHSVTPSYSVGGTRKGIPVGVLLHLCVPSPPQELSLGGKSNAHGCVALAKVTLHEPLTQACGSRFAHSRWWWRRWWGWLRSGRIRRRRRDSWSIHIILRLLTTPSISRPAPPSPCA